VHASLLLLVRVLVRLHKVAMHDNTRDMTDVSTHSNLVVFGIFGLVVSAVTYLLRDKVRQRLSQLLRFVECLSAGNRGGECADAKGSGCPKYD
jgi:hypothetical protein